MRVFAVSDIHIDYQENKQWILDLSSSDYQQDILILAGDISDKLALLEWCFNQLERKFYKVIFVPGNHELWVNRDKHLNSIEKFNKIYQLTLDSGIAIEPFHFNSITIVPLFSWYDYTFGEPDNQLLKIWVDFRACSWPEGMSMTGITEFFLNKNKPYLNLSNDTLISFSHFLPRIDLMPPYIPMKYRYLYPALGSELLDLQIRQLKPEIHVYGHSHVNRNIQLNGIRYINNAFGYPAESSITGKELVCVYQQ